MKLQNYEELDFFFPIFISRNFSWTIANCKNLKDSVESLRALSLSPPIFCLKGKKNVVYLVSVFLSSVEERTQIMKTYSLV